MFVKAQTYGYPLLLALAPIPEIELLHLSRWVKGIVSRVWEQLQWNPSDRSEEFRTAGAYFYSLLVPFSRLNSKKAFCAGFSFDSNSANDE